MSDSQNTINDDKENEAHNFEVTSDNSIYSLDILKDRKEEKDVITFMAFDKNCVSNTSYQNSFCLEELVKFSKIFKLCDTVTDALDIILQTFRTNEIKIIQKDKLYLSVGFKLPGDKFDEINIPLEKGKVNDAVLLEKICQNLSKIQIKNNQLEKEIKFLKEENQKLTEKLFGKENNTLIDIMEQKFLKSKYTLQKDLSTHLKDFGLILQLINNF